jgi:hypothetical protein
VVDLLTLLEGDGGHLGFDFVLFQFFLGAVEL